MNILFITQHYLSGVGGGVFASRAYINAFAENADEMTLLYLTKGDQNVFPEINTKIKLYPVSNDISKWKKGLALLCGRTHHFQSVVTRLLKESHYDLVVFDNSKTSFRLIDVVHKYGCKAIVINHNYEYEYTRDNSKGIFRPITLFWIKRVEKEAAQKADLNLTLSNQDTKLLCDAFRKGDQSNFKLLGTFEYKRVPIRDFTTVQSKQQRFVITGSLDAQQTEDSLVPWLVDYYPIFREEFPNATLTIAGKNPTQKIQQLCKERGINLIPSPDSMDPIMENADYYICPTCLGGGIKLRVMDGLKWGLPVITHEVSARGYDLFVQNGCMVSYNNTSSFKSSLEKLKAYQFDKESVYSNYRDIFSFEAGVERVKTVLSSLRLKELI